MKNNNNISVDKSYRTSSGRYNLGARSEYRWAPNGDGAGSAPARSTWDNRRHHAGGTYASVVRRALRHLLGTWLLVQMGFWGADIAAALFRAPLYTIGDLQIVAATAGGLVISVFQMGVTKVS